MKLPKISYDPISKLIDLLVDAGIDKIKEKTDRSARVIAIRKQLGLGADKPLADDFDGVYAFTLAKYYEGDYPKAILDFFGDAIIRNAFRKSFEQRDFGILEDETENFLDWNLLGKGFRELDIQPQAQFERFQLLFYESIELTKRPIDFVHSQRDEDLDKDISSLRDEFEEIKEGTKEQVLPPPLTLPPIDISKFTGREEELKKLEELIFNQEGSRVVGIVGLTGTGGMGKSALAVYFAYKYKNRFPDGIVGIRVDRATTDEIARSFALQVVTKVDPELKASQVMQRHFQNRQMLLILDNVEDATARELGPGGDKCAVIITTRNRNLNLGTTGQIDLNRFSLKETRDLLVSFLGEKRVDEEPDAAQRIHEFVGGLPLAIRIVGGALVDEKETTLNEFADRLENERNRLYLNDPDDESLDVHASINVSLRKLNEEQIHLYSCLSVCAPDGFSSDTVKAISLQEIDIAKANLARLVKLSLLDFSDEKKRYLLHPLLFDAATELAKGKNKEILSNDIYAVLLARHIAYFRDYAQNHKGLQPIDLISVEREINELLLTAKRLVNEKKADYGYYLALEPFFQARGYWSQALELISLYLKLAKDIDDSQAIVQFLIQRGQFLQAIGKLSDAEKALNESDREISKIEDSREQNRLRAMVLNSLGVVLQRQGKFEEAVEIFRRSAAIEDASGNTRGQAIVLNSMGSALQRQGKFEEAVKAFEASAIIEEKSGNKRGQAMVLNSLGGVLQRQGDFQGAVDNIQKSYNILVSIGDERGQAMVLNSLGGVYQRQGKFDEAVITFQQSAEIEEKLKNDRGQAMVLNSLGGVLQRQGDFQGAVDNIQKSYNILVSIGDERGQAMVLNSLGGVLQRQGKFEEAVTAFQKSYAISERLDDDRSLAIVLNSLGGVLQRQGKFEEAVTAFQKSYELLVKLEDDRGQAMVLNSLGGVLQRQGKFEEAVTAFQKSYELLVKLEDDRGQAMVLNSLGGVLQRQGKFEEAVTAFQKSYELLVKLEDDRGQAMVLNSLGGVLQRQGKFEEAVTAFQKSYELLVKLEDDRGQAMVLNSLGGVLQRQGKFEEAVTAFQKSYELLVKLEDDRGQAMVLNSLGGVLSKQKKYTESEKAFKSSITIGKRLRDKSHLSKVHTAFGKSLLTQNKHQDALIELQEGFEIDESLHNKFGMRIVTPALVNTLVALGNKPEAIKICNRALSIAPKDNQLLQIQRQLLEKDNALQKSGHIKKLLRHERGYLYGFIETDDKTPDIYFNERQVDQDLFVLLKEGVNVIAEIDGKDQRPRAIRIWLKEITE